MARRPPFPSVLPGRRGGRWIVEEGRGSTCIATHQMSVPMGASPRDRRTRQHELGHAAFSPISLRVPRGLGKEIVQWVEEARVHWRLREAGLDLDAPVYGDVTEALLRDMRDRSVEAPSIVMTLLGLAGTGDFEAAIEAAETLFAEDGSVRSGYQSYLVLAQRAAAMVADAPKRFATTIRVSWWLQELLSLMSAAQATGVSLPAEMLANFIGRAGDETGSWGRLTVERPALRHPSGARARRRPASSSSGFVPLALHRLLLDQRIFVGRRPSAARGPTVLIDCSSSMELDARAVGAFIAAFPRACIATYSGDGVKGVLRVVACAGRVAEPHLLEPPAGSGNIVDGPALDWLVRQPPPRLWVTDGLVTGVGDFFAANLLREALDFCRRCEVRIFASLQNALDAQLV